MAKFLYVGSHASDDPTKAALALAMAKGAIAAGHQCTIALVGEGVWLTRDIVAENTRGVGWPNAQELLQDLVVARVPIYV